MNAKHYLVMLFSASTLFLTSLSQAQPQIPTLQVCNGNLARSEALVEIDARMPPAFSGSFELHMKLECELAGSGYPVGAVNFMNIDMNDSVLGAIVSSSIEQVTTAGRATPMLYVNGRCKVDPAADFNKSTEGCRFWLMATDNRGNLSSGQTPDIVSFLVFNKFGQRIAYASGPVVKGDVQVAVATNE